MPKKSWIEQQRIESGRLGDLVDGVNILERNRATVYEWRAGGVKELRDYMVNNYLAKGVRAVLYGVRLPSKSSPRKLGKEIFYAVFCQDGFVTNEDSESDEA